MHNTSLIRILLAGSSLFAAAGIQAQIATGTTGINASGNYSQEVAACLSGRTQQDKNTCLIEARSARAAARRGGLQTDSASFKANAVARCDALKGADGEACRARVLGYGDASGSVAGGGVIRQVETINVPADASSVRVRPQTDNPVIIMEAPKR